jgi:hypothetical protein
MSTALAVLWNPLGVSVIGFALSQTGARHARQGHVYKSGRGASFANLWNVAPKGALESRETSLFLQWSAP